MRSSHSHIISFDTNITTMYLVSIDGKATIDCFFEHQLTHPLLSMKIQPEVNFWLTLLPIQLESEQPLKKSLSSLPYMMSWSIISLRYQKMVFTTLICCLNRFFTNQLIIEVEKAIFGLVFIIKNIHNLIISQQVLVLEGVFLLSILGNRDFDFFIRVLIVLILLR